MGHFPMTQTPKVIYEILDAASLVPDTFRDGVSNSVVTETSQLFLTHKKEVGPASSLWFFCSS